jgi:hypothetical protein
MNHSSSSAFVTNNWRAFNKQIPIPCRTTKDAHKRALASLSNALHCLMDKQNLLVRVEQALPFASARLRVSLIYPSGNAKHCRAKRVRACARVFCLSI